MAGSIPITAVVLAGGAGTRLKSVVSDRPKVLAEIHGRPFLSFLLDQLAGEKVGGVVISTGFMAEAVEAAFGKSYRGVPVTYSRENQPLGTGGGLRLAVPQTDSDPLLVLNGDSYCGFDLADFLGRHRARKAVASILLTQVGDTSRFGKVKMDDGGRVMRFEEKGGLPEAGWINAGIYLINRAAVLSIPASGVVSLEREIFPSWIGKGLFATQGPGPFIDIGTPESYRAAEAFFAAGK